MSQDPEFRTVTMAKVYQRQGHLQHAAQIYRLMLQQQPDRQDLQSALAALENPRPSEAPTLPDLVRRFSLWLELSGRYQRLQRLRRLTHRLPKRAGAKSD